MLDIDEVQSVSSVQPSGDLKITVGLVMAQSLVIAALEIGDVRRAQQEMDKMRAGLWHKVYGDVQRAVCELEYEVRQRVARSQADDDAIRERFAALHRLLSLPPKP